jgi:biopolymer transport protein ExbD
MARREGEEISAGSMADIAFLLLIFFIVTTTMELEAGIPQQLALKLPPPIGYEPPEVKKRDVFSISVNDNDQLYVEDEIHLVEDIELMVYDYFTANMYNNTDSAYARYVGYSAEGCKAEIEKFKAELDAGAEFPILVESKVLKWEKRLMVCEAFPSNSYRVIHETAVIQIKQKAKSSYGTYIAIQNEIKKVIYQVRDEKCKEIYNGLSYFDLDEEIEEDRDKIKTLNILVPERILEPEIKN